MEPHEKLYKPPQPLILFDGVCNWCIFWVRFVIKRDPQKRFRFASLQSATGRRILETIGLPVDELNTMIFVDKNGYYTKSSAALHIVKKLKGLWPTLFVLIVIPRFIRNHIYDFIGRNRYRWFGKRNSCLVPTPDVRERFFE